jgi:hypothetical protein
MITGLIMINVSRSKPTLARYAAILVMIITRLVWRTGRIYHRNNVQDAIRYTPRLRLIFTKTIAKIVTGIYVNGVTMRHGGGGVVKVFLPNFLDF